MLLMCAVIFGFTMLNRPSEAELAERQRIQDSIAAVQKQTQAANKPLTMLTPDEAVELLGHAVGGVCPFALKEGVDVYLDVSMQRFETVLPAAGSSNSCVELTCGELEKAACGFRGWGDFCKAWQETEAQ